MYPVSTGFKTAVRDSHVAVIRAEVWRADAQVLTLEATGGQVEVDARRGVRRTCQLTIPAPDPQQVIVQVTQTYLALARDHATYTAMAASVSAYSGLVVSEGQAVEYVDAGIVPDTEWSPLAPFGNELRLWRGITYSTMMESSTTYQQLAAEHGTYLLLAAEGVYATLNTATLDAAEVTELVPLGVFVITKVTVTSGPGGTQVNVSGSDRSLRISRNRWTEPYTVDGGNVATALRALLEDRWDDVVCSFAATDATVNRAVLGLETSNDPWADAVKIAEAAGLDLFFDGDGVARLEPVRDYDTATADATYLEDEEAMVLDVSRSLTAERTYNGAIVAGEGSEATGVFRGEAWDDDPASPTYRYGPFGQVPIFYASPLMTSDAMCNQAALTILAKKRGLQEAVEWSQIVDPSLDVGDVIGVYSSGAKVNKVMVLDRVTVPLGAAEPMRAVARTVRSLGATGFDEEESGG